MDRVDGHKQYQKCISIRIVSVTDWLARVDKQEDVVYGHANDNDESDGSEDNDDAFIDELFYFSFGLFFLSIHF